MINTWDLDRQADLEKTVKINTMVCHDLLYHQRKEAKVKFYMSVESVNIDALTKQLREGVAIISNQDILLNRKQESLQEAVPSTRIQRGLGRYKLLQFHKMLLSNLSF